MPGIFAMLLDPPDEETAEDAAKREFCERPELNEALNEYYRKTLPPADKRSRYRELFFRLSGILRINKIDPMTAHGAIAAMYLFRGNINADDVRDCAAAIVYYQAIYRGAAFIGALLAAADALDCPDDGGGGEELEGGEEAPAEIESVSIGARH